MNTSRLGIIYQHTLVLTMINLCKLTKFEMPIASTLTTEDQNVKNGHVTLTTSVWG